MPYFGVRPADITSAAEAEIAGDLTVDTNTLVVDAANNRVGINTTSMDAALQVQNGDITVGWADNFIGTQFQDGSAFRLGMKFATVNRTLKLVAETSDNNGEITFETNGSERARVTDNGLTFNGDTAAANALDDYEEGTWTPTDNSGAGLTFTNGDGYYTKVGRQVFAAFRLTYPSTSDTNMASIAGLPFTAGNITDAMFGGSSTYHQDSGIGQPFSFLVADNGSFLAIFYDGSSQRGNNNFSGKPLRGFVIYNV